MEVTPTEVAICEVVESVIPISPELDIVIVAGVEIEVASGSYVEGENIVLLQGPTVNVLPASVLPNPPIGEMLIQHKGLDVSNLIL